MDKTQILGVDVSNAKKDQILEFIFDSLQNSQENYYITTPNPEMVVYAHHYKEFLDVLNRSKVALADGIGLLWAAKIEAKSLVGRTTGVEMLENLCSKASKKPITVGFLGAKGKIAELAAQCLAKKYPGLRVVLARGWDPNPETVSRLEKDIENYFKTGKTAGFSAIGHSLGEEQEGIEELGDPKLYQKESKHARGKGKGESVKKTLPLTLNASPLLDILFVAYGHPKQEYFMSQYVDTLPVKVMMGVGGALDYISGQVPRAPKVLQSVGLEWLYRLIRQPWRIKRQIALIEFVWLVLRQKYLRRKENYEF